MIPTKALFPLQDADERSLELLLGALEENNLPGFDYIEFKRAAVALQRMDLDEATAYKSAFTTAATVGLSKEKLLESAKYYSNLIEQEQAQFEAALQSRREREVTAREREIARLKDQIERHRAEIARLQDELGRYLNDIERAEAARQSEEQKLARAQAAFDQTRQALLRSIEQDIERLHRYL
ncbi:MAG: hypothetical protein RMJ33_10285 [Saprospiraceae bacterium]|nr:hypothetical protein [Saprospiraceae bacterium]MDW8230214.1 hypothetical protein [Saprospiraceae bacterium]